MTDPASSGAAGAAAFKAWAERPLWLPVALVSLPWSS